MDELAAEGVLRHAKFLRRLASAELNGFLDGLRLRRQLGLEDYHRLKAALYIVEAFDFAGRVCLECPPENEQSYEFALDNSAALDD